MHGRLDMAFGEKFSIAQCERTVCARRAALAGRLER
ncbi:hypothetical protein AWB78_08587 [Caballeronia calidae]|uniref:Uncharacterized protein n=1 Tax=Caballeronia calidae TaxID=1777139 RepID=A0A158EKX6_9BURK|nr:hypothetical protein AWB78_08587 [Caballeronia calidae]